MRGTLVAKDGVHEAQDLAAVPCDRRVRRGRKILGVERNSDLQLDLVAHARVLAPDHRDQTREQRDRKSTRLNSSHTVLSRMPSSA